MVKEPNKFSKLSFEAIAIAIPPIPKPVAKAAMLADGELSLLDGTVLLSALILFLFLLSKRGPGKETTAVEAVAASAGLAWLKFLGGLVL